MKHIFYLSIAVSVICFSCHNTTRQYYEGGKLKSEEKVLSDSTCIITEYYKNGKVKEIINFKDSFANGYSESYYSDGTLKWNGYYENGCPLCPPSNNINDSTLYINLRCKKEVHIGDTCEFRVIATSFFEKRCYVINPSTKVLFENNRKDSDLYPYIVIPIDTGDVYINLEFANEDGKIIIGERTLEYFMFHVYPK